MGLLGKRQTVGLKIEGMTCGHCEQKVGEAIRSVKGVRSLTIDRPAGRGKVEVDQGADTAALVAAVKKVGYHATIEAPSA